MVQETHKAQFLKANRAPSQGIQTSRTYLRKERQSKGRGTHASNNATQDKGRLAKYTRANEGRGDRWGTKLKIINITRRWEGG